MPATFFQVFIPYYSSNRATGELYLKHAIESVQKQIFKDWRLVVVDDRSPIEGVEEFVASFKDSRISYVCNPKNLGEAGNCNRCMDMVEADHFSILHADDEMKPDYIATMLRYSKANPDSAAIFCNADIMNESGTKVFSFVDFVKKGLKSSGEFHLKGDEGLANIMRGNFIMCPTVCYNRRLLGDLRFNAEKWRTIPDFYFWANLLLNDRQITGIPENLFNYRRHSESATHTVRKGTKIFEEEASFYEFVGSQALAKGFTRAVKVAEKKRMIKLRTLYFLAMDIKSARFAAAKDKWTFFRGL